MAHEFTIESAVFGTVAAAVGWFAGYVLTGWREARTKRLQLEIERASSQIKEFYAPLMALTDQLNATVDAVLVRAAKGKEGADYHKLAGIVYDRFFLPIHEEINSILKSKIHLHEGAIPPPSFTDYFAHYAAEKAYWKLSELGEDVSQMEIPGYPASFYHDVRSGYAEVVNRYEKALQELRPRKWLFDADDLLTKKVRDALQKRSTNPKIMQPDVSDLD
jgi:hypothetical protein